MRITARCSRLTDSILMAIVRSPRFGCLSEAVRVLSKACSRLGQSHRFQFDQKGLDAHRRVSQALTLSPDGLTESVRVGIEELGEQVIRMVRLDAVGYKRILRKSDRLEVRITFARAEARPGRAGRQRQARQGLDEVRIADDKAIATAASSLTACVLGGPCRDADCSSGPCVPLLENFSSVRGPEAPACGVARRDRGAERNTSRRRR